MTPGKHGMELLEDSTINTSTILIEFERTKLGLLDLNPDVTETVDIHMRRVMMQLSHKHSCHQPAQLRRGLARPR